MKTLNLHKPYDLFDLIKSDLNPKLIDDLFYTNKPYFKNLSNIKDLEDHVLLEMIVPGFKKNEIEITIENNLLNVSAKKQQDIDNQNEKYVLKEFFIQNFVKNFKVNPEMNVDLIESKLEDGILQIVIPKAKKVENKKIIKIN